MTPQGSAPALTRPGAQLLLAGFVVLHVALALASAGPTARTFTALALTCGVAAVVVLSHRLGLAALVAAVAGTLAAVGLVLASLPIGGWPGYAAWPAGATAFVALCLAVRGRIGVAWVLLAGLALEAVAWSSLEGAGPLPGIDLVVRHAGTLLLGTLFAIGLRRSARSLAALRAVERRTTATQAAAASADAARRHEAERVLRLAGPALQELADGERPGRRSLLALEGRLRDRITTSLLRSDALSAALGAARDRGVDVVLLVDLQDRPLGDEVRMRVTDWLTDRMRGTPRGRLVARVTRDGDRVRISFQGAAVHEVLELDD